MKCITRKIILSILLIFFFSACKEDVKKTMQTPNKRMNLFKGFKNISSVKLPKDITVVHFYNYTVQLEQCIAIKSRMRVVGECHC